MVKEPHTKRQRPPTATDAMSRLVQKAKNLAILGCLTTNEKHRVAHAITISQSTQTAWKRQKYKLFLCNILECSGPHSFLLCAIALGQVIVANMKQRDRDRLEALVKSDTTISQHRIRNLAIQNQVPESLEGEF